jgi:mannose-6-phosphate isomerase-like protein (cupin superfamily)
VSADRAESRKVRLRNSGLEGLEQTVLECAPGTSTSRATGEAEEVLFVVAGQGELRLPGGERHPLEPETGVNLGPGQEYELRNETSDPMRMVSVQIRGPGAGRAPGGGVDGALDGGPGPARMVVRRLADQEAQNATSEREFRIVADPSTGLRSATHFVGYVPTVRAPDHFHTYDEVIYVLEGEGAFHAGDTSRPIGAGSCIELPARTVHCLENTGPAVMRLVAVFRPPGSPAAAYYPDGTPAYPGTPTLMD